MPLKTGIFFPKQLISSYFPKQFTVGLSLRKKRGWPRYALATFPELVRHVSALCLLGPSLRTLSTAMCPPCVRHVSTLCPPCVRLVSGLAAPPNLVRRVSAMYPPCAHLVSALGPPCVRFGAPPNLVCHVALCVHHVSAPCLLFALSSFALCRSLSAFCGP